MFGYVLLRPPRFWQRSARTNGFRRAAAIWSCCGSPVRRSCLPRNRTRNSEQQTRELEMEQQRRECVSLVRCQPESSDDQVVAATGEAIARLGDLSEITAGK